MKVGMLTFHLSFNYGAALQSYAMRQWSIEHGRATSFIEYRPAHIEFSGRLSLPTSSALIKAKLKAIYLTASSFANRHFGSQSQKVKLVRFREQYLGVVDIYQDLHLIRELLALQGGSRGFADSVGHFFVVSSNICAWGE